ncbi:MAG: CRISPR-associated endonuclease Cas2 [SAR324 cluster bacterium]|nr:CRISPR-associated endonuclease Cas2 [SAR324 cluster bacterium]
MSKTFSYLVCYDISDPPLLQRVAYYLEKKGLRLQKSIFILNLPQHEIDSVKHTLFKMVGHEHHIMILPLCRSCVNKAVFLGDSIDEYLVY